jgi:hypothetical protein
VAVDECLRRYRHISARNVCVSGSVEYAAVAFMPRVSSRAP